MTSDTAPGAAALQVNCSFCAKPSSAVAKVIAGPGVYICNECIHLCNDILLGSCSHRPRRRPSCPPGRRR